MNANFDPKALGALFALYQQREQQRQEETQPPITIKNLGQALTMIGENIDELTPIETLNVSAKSVEVVQNVSELCTLIENLRNKYGWNIDDYTE